MSPFPFFLPMNAWVNTALSHFLARTLSSCQAVRPTFPIGCRGRTGPAGYGLISMTRVVESSFFVDTG
jgi:hypothetical protein